jgi:hypothetical protein
VSIKGGSGTLGQASLPLTNLGTITADGAGKVIRVLANPFTNNGTIQELNGGKVTIVPP